MSTTAISLIIVALLVPFSSALGTQVASYDNKRMLSFIEAINGSVSDQLYLSSATWGKLRADYPRDVGKIEDLSETLKRIMCQTVRNISLSEQLQGYLLREHIREHLEILNTTGIFREALEAPEHEQGKWQLLIGKHSQKLHCLYKEQQLRKIIEQVIRRLFTPDQGSQLAAQLYQLYLANNRDSYELMVNSELWLYERYKTTGKQRKDFTIYMAQLWQQIQKEHFYAGLDQQTKQRLVEAVIELLAFV